MAATNSATTQQRFSTAARRSSSSSSSSSALSSASFKTGSSSNSNNGSNSTAVSSRRASMQSNGNNLVLPAASPAAASVHPNDISPRAIPPLLKSSRRPSRPMPAGRARARKRRESALRRPTDVFNSDLPRWTAADNFSADVVPFGWRRRPRGLMYDGEAADERGLGNDDRANAFLCDLDLEEEEEDEDEDDDEVDDDDDDFGLDLMDLPDHALANAFFSGFLDSIKVVSCLRLVSKRMMAVGSDSCKILDLHGMRLSDDDLTKVTAAFPHIIHLDLSYCKGLGNCVGASLRACTDTLRTLSLRGVGASDETIRGLCEFRHLRELDLCQIVAGDSNKITPAGLEALVALDQLEKLGLAWNKGVTDDALDQLCGAMGGLRELDLALCNKITARSLQALSLHSNLEVLSVQACRLIDDNGIEVLTTACPNLVSLDVAHLPLLTANALNSLRLLRKLRKLDVRCCEQISTADVANFKARRPHTWVAELRSWWP